MAQKIEVLAPAGDYTTLKAAVSAGADAVYVGGERFGARVYAKNFNKEELLSAIDYVHLHGKKLYLTVNTLVKEREFHELYDYLLPFYTQGLDAVIVQDIGVMDYIQKQFPGLAIHASTQMTITNVISAKYLESIGVERIVPARELSLKEITDISTQTNLEIECFVHGALCYCYSGQCLLSSMIGGRSGNRGQCAQPCRLSYTVNGNRTQDILSLKDLCTIDAIPDLIESGIMSFKIEGRMKQPGYVATVTRMYRKYVDLYLKKGRKDYQVSEQDRKELEQAYQRRGYCDGYYFRHNGKDMLSLQRPSQEELPEWKEDTKCQEKINGKLTLSPGKHATLYLKYQEIKLQISGEVAENATKQPVSRERLEKQLRKTGNTPFVFETLDIAIDGEVFIPIQAVNELRRQGLEALEDRILCRYRRAVPDRINRRDIPEICKNEETPVLNVSVETLEQMELAVDYSGISRIYVEDAMWDAPDKRGSLKKLTARAKTSGKQVYFAMARIFRKEAELYYRHNLEELLGVFDGVLVRNLESYLCVREYSENIPVVTDSTIYQWNRYARDWWSRMSIESSVAPVELNRWEMEELDVNNMEIIAYGYLPVMVSAGCVKKNTRGCDRRSGFLTMKDRQRKTNRVKNECAFCYNVIYNSMPLILADQYEALLSLRPGALRLQFTWESPNEMREILGLFQSAMEGKNIQLPANTEFTRGHFKRGVK